MIDKTKVEKSEAKATELEKKVRMGESVLAFRVRKPRFSL